MAEIDLCMGDPSDDGHGKTDVRTYSVYFNTSDVPCLWNPADVLAYMQRAYEVAAKQIGLDIVASVCDAFDDDMLSIEDAAILKAQFPDLPWADLEAVPETRERFGKGGWREEAHPHAGKYRMTTDFFARLYAAYVMLGNPDITMVALSSNPVLYIGGYGLFMLD